MTHGSRLMAHGVRCLAFLAVAALAVLVAPTRTADHRDAPGINEDGRADLLDVYAFVNPDNGNVVLAQTVNPFTIGGTTGVAFAADVLYEFKIDNTGDNVEDLVIQATFTPVVPGPQQFSVRGPAKPRLSGVASSLLVADAPAISGTADGTIATASGSVVRAFAGQRDDPFFVDLIWVLRLIGGLPGGPLTRAPGIDFFAGLNCTALVIEVPAAALRGSSGNVIKIWATTSRPKNTIRSGSAYLADTHTGPFVQIDRTALPTLNTVLMPLRLKDAFNRATPSQDGLFRDAAIASLVRINNDPTYSQTLLDAVLFPDVAILDLGKTTGFLNGRRPQDDVIDVVLSAASKGGVAGDAVAANDVPFLSSFPFLAPPHGPDKPIPARNR